VPLDNLAEARLLPASAPGGVRSLRDLVLLLTGEPYDETVPPAAPRLPLCSPTSPTSSGRSPADGGRGGRRRRAPRAAARSAGSGKTMLAERLPGLLPPARRSRRRWRSPAVHSVAGRCPTTSR
jgi:magnesium chelatase family protein